MGEATLPLANQLELTFEEWSKDPLIQKLLAVSEVKIVADKLAGLRGSPEAENQEQFEILCKQATKAVTAALEEFFKVQKDPRDCADYHSEVWVSFMRYFEVEDIDFVEEMCVEGAPAGINIEIPLSNGLHPIAKSKASTRIYRSNNGDLNYDAGMPHSEVMSQ
ncbi:hypothetical protein Pmar_PMAR027637 [Perkinsus marinus ATCC 50983]|uniref:Uncharacterized protein n=1 Tax=Perkinsus marinus (strain ATCC 50983 / TXsc) TaxID=423536 RepID=C5KCA8_PERM5|nr:hypothetical protein Pmar_PMAR027637 [Perkinsus marinus ATCC 50983]EER17921.1 hypothetical protein Pmar_PMAR027637 [Perkinsus marinus ATCC 50983]|eukprot:XP_002786125.1 hypothetical protein Pmar_PMAR027637 [Perkinsus marinus ATCC 50983]